MRRYGYWKKEENVRQFLVSLQKHFNFKNTEDWNSLSQRQIKAFGGSTLLGTHTLYQLKCLACPEIKIKYPKKELEIKPNGYWDNETNVLEFLNNIKEQYNIKNTNDWCKIKRRHIIELGGGSLLNKYTSMELKKMICPEIEKEFPELYDKNRNGRGFWRENKNILEFINKLKCKYNLNSKEDWENLNCKHIEESGGISLLNQYSLFELKKFGFPELKKTTSDTRKQKGYWKDENNVLAFLNDLKEKNNINSTEDWSNITCKQIIDLGGIGLFPKYSLFELKCLGCPEIKTKYPQLNRKKNKPKGFWDNSENIKEYLESLGKKFNLKTIDDWNRLSKKQIESLGGSRLFAKYNSIYEIFSIAYPDKIWDRQKLSSKDKRSNQRWLFIQIQKIFPGEEIVEDYFHSELTRISGFPVQFDIFLVKRNIAFEYHGIHHYEDNPAAFGNLDLYISADSEKKKICQKFNIPLIVVPYWWDLELNSLSDIIKEEYEDILK